MPRVKSLYRQLIPSLADPERAADPFAGGENPFAISPGEKGAMLTLRNVKTSAAVSVDPMIVQFLEWLDFSKEGPPMPDAARKWMVEWATKGLYGADEAMSDLFADSMRTRADAAYAALLNAGVIAETD